MLWLLAFLVVVLLVVAVVAWWAEEREAAFDLERRRRFDRAWNLREDGDDDAF